MTPNEAFIYVIQCGDFPYYKIGLAKNLQRRRENIQTANPFPITIIIAVQTDGATALERLLHDKFKKQWLHGEWYVLTKQDLEELQGILQSSRTAIMWLKTQINFGKLNLEKD